MVEVTYLDLAKAMSWSVPGQITASRCENIIDLAIDMLNLYADTGLSNMSGAAGSKTVTLTSRQRAIVLFLCRGIFYSFQKDITPTGVGGIMLNPADLMSNPNFMAFMREASDMLRTRKFERV